MTTQEIYEEAYDNAMSHTEPDISDMRFDWAESEAKKAEDARASMLSLLNDPAPGTIVKGEGFTFVKLDKTDGWGVDGIGDWGYSLYGVNAIPMLRALVRYGGAQVTPPQEDLS